VQLASLGCPIIGDELYGSTVAYQPNAIALHAAKLSVQHPITNQIIVFEAKADFLVYSCFMQ
jgi:23S rRNA-/tRNA-specific pseudouridylate synthase